MNLGETCLEREGREQRRESGKQRMLAGKREAVCWRESGKPLASPRLKDRMRSLMSGSSVHLKTRVIM